MNYLIWKFYRKICRLYSSDACEEDLVHTAITNNIIDNLRMPIYKLANIMKCSITDFTSKKSPKSSFKAIVMMFQIELYTLLCWIIVGSLQDLETSAVQGPMWLKEQFWQNARISGMDRRASKKCSEHWICNIQDATSKRKSTMTEEQEERQS